jgi:hypothetical protein
MSSEVATSHSRGRKEDAQKSGLGSQFLRKVRGFDGRVTIQKQQWPTKITLSASWDGMSNSFWSNCSGTMGVAIVSGILDSIIHPSESIRAPSSGTSTPNPLANIPHRMPNKFIACVKRDESASTLRHTFNKSLVRILCRENVKGAQDADLILLGAKPNMCKEILTQEGMHEALEGKLLISIATGVTLAQMREWCPESTHIVRAMPNVPCKVRPW